MLGNLREWTATMLRPYPYRHDGGREGWTGLGAVVVRGDRATSEDLGEIAR